MNRRDLFAATAAPLGAGVVAAALVKPAVAQTQVAADSGLHRILSRGKINVGTRSTTIGFGFKDDKGELTGFDIELSREVARGLFDDPSKVDFEIFPGGGERIPALVAGRVDIVISQFSVFESRAQSVEFSLPYCNSDFSAIVRADSPYHKHLDLADKVVTTRQGDDLRAQILKAIPTAKVEMYPNFSDSFLAFRQGRAEAFFDDSAPARYIIQEFPGQFRVINDPENRIDVNQYSIGLAQGDQVFLNYINWSLVRMRMEGRLQALHRKWLQNEELLPAWARVAV
jgi:polar amino acid transport system substrate-binding protein